MVEISRFVHTFDLGEHIALWHSLRMKLVFLTQERYANLASGYCDDDLRQQLAKNKFILSRKSDDDNVIGWLREQAPQPAISLCYFILSERCNLACKYCFLGNSSERRKKFLPLDMSKEVAEKAISFFGRQLELSGIDFSKNKSQLIFFGGEPTINFEVLEYVAQKINNLKDAMPVFAGTEMTIITNGTLLTQERLVRLNDLGVTVNISIDGFTEEANEMRVDTAGNTVFGKLIAVLDLCKNLKITPSLSVSLSEKTIRDLPGLLNLVKRYNIKGLGYNIPLSNESYQLPAEYYAGASQFIIDSFLALRELGVYEDRIMRKLNSFASSQVYFSDCGVTSGGQLVFSPDGRVGICHEMLAEKENFVTTVDDNGFDATRHPLWQQWANYIPIKNDECINCEALGICGGGCPVNARYADPTKGLHCLDERSCIHAKSTLKFLIEDLYQIARKRTEARAL